MNMKEIRKEICPKYVTEPNGMRLTVARVIMGGDFQASHCCNGCKVVHCEIENWEG